MQISYEIRPSSKVSSLPRDLVETLTARSIEPLIPTFYQDVYYVASIIANEISAFVTYVTEFTFGNLMSVLRLITLANLALDAADAVEMAVQTSLDVINQIVNQIMPTIEHELNRLVSRTSKNSQKQLPELVVTVPFR